MGADPIRVAIVGGGIAGLAAAHALSVACPDATTVVLEASAHLGGKLRPGGIAGITVDLGAEAILARRPEALELIEAVGLGDRIIHPATTRAGIWTHGDIRPIPPTVMGIPADLDALAASGILTEPPRSTGAALPAGDVSVAEFVAARVGTEVLDRLVEPLLGGVYAGHAARLSLLAAAPQIAALAPDLLAAARAAHSARGAADGPVFAGLRGGIGQLPAAVAAASGARISTRATVRQIRRTPSGWALVVGPTNAIETLPVDAVIVATPAPATARLLADIAPRAAVALAAIEYASMAIVTIALPRAAFATAPSGSGFLVPPVDGRAIKAVTYSSNKWGWLAQAAGPDLVILRCSIGRAGEPALLQRDDAGLIALALADLRAAAGVTGAPVEAIVTRWGGALPQYAVGHLDRMALVDADLATVPRLEVCGAAYRGIGIPAVIASARGAVARLLAGPGTMEP